MQLPQKKPQLVIFDCDGVLVDSEPIFIRTLQKYLGVGAAGLGVEELQAICVGKTRADVEELLCRLGVAFPPTWPGDFYERLFRAFKDEIRPIPGALYAISRIVASGISVCVASNGSKEKVTLLLEHTGLLPFFGDRVYTLNDVGAGKPAPDLFLHAAGMTGVNVSECVVVEDSISGFRAAEKAAMKCFAFCPLGQGGRNEYFPAYPFSDMRSLPDLIGT